MLPRLLPDSVSIIFHPKLLLGVNTSLAVNQLQAAINHQQLVSLQTHSDLRQIQLSLNSHDRLGHEVYSRVERMEEEVKALAVGDPCVPENNHGVSGLLV